MADIDASDVEQAKASLEQFLEAGLRKDEPAMRARLTRRSQDAGNFNPSGGPEGVTFSLGDATIEQDSIIIPVTATPIEGGPDVEVPGGPMLTAVMVREDGEWKFDLATTMDRMMGGMVEALGEKMGEAMGAMSDAIGSALESALGPSAETSGDADEHDGRHGGEHGGEHGGGGEHYGELLDKPPVDSGEFVSADLGAGDEGREVTQQDFPEDARFSSDDRYERAAAYMDRLERALQHADLWPDKPRPAALQVQGAFGEHNMPFGHWLAWVLIPRVRQIVETRGNFPQRSSTGAYALRVLGLQPGGEEIISLLSDFDAFVENR